MLDNGTKTLPLTKEGILQKAGNLQRRITNLRVNVNNGDAVSLQSIKNSINEAISPLFTAPSLSYSAIAKNVEGCESELILLEAKINATHKFEKSKLD